MGHYMYKLLNLVLAVFVMFLVFGCCPPFCPKEDPYSNYHWKRVDDPNSVFVSTTQGGNIFLKDAIELPSVGQPGGPGFVVVGHEWMVLTGQHDRAKAAAWISNDGQNWCRVHYWGFEAGDSSAYMTAATRFRNKIVAVGVLWDYDKPPEAATSAKAWTSDNGIVWNAFVMDGGVYTQQRPPWLDYDRYTAITEPAFGPTDVAASEECVVAVGSNYGSATIWRSTDGQNWTRVNIAEPYSEDRSHIVSVVRINNSFLAFGGYERGGPAMWKSTDGIAWTVERLFPQGKFLYSATLQDDGWGWILGKGTDGFYLAWQRDHAGTLEEPWQVRPEPGQRGDYTIRWTHGNIGGPLIIMSHKPDGGIQVRRWSKGRFLSDSLSPTEGECRLYGRRVESLCLQPQNPIRMLIGHAREVHIDPLLEGPAHGAIWIWAP